MTTYTAITNGEIDPDSPITTSLMTKLRDNPIAITEGASGAPQIQTAAIADSAITTVKIADANVTKAKLASSIISVGAWLKFTDSGTAAIVDSQNVASITDHGVGDYSITVTTAFANANYAGAAIARDTAGVGANACFAVQNSSRSQTTTVFPILHWDIGGAEEDPEGGCVILVGDQ